MKVEVKNITGGDDLRLIAHAIGKVDPMRRSTSTKHAPGEGGLVRVAASGRGWIGVVTEASATCCQPVLGDES